jgi:hypothetical protein
MSNSLSKLLCGNYQDLGELSNILRLLDSKIETFSNKCFNFLEQEAPDDITTLGAYCGRTLLEASCIALIGRISPYRLLLLQRYQRQTDYEAGIRHNMSIAWTGDILPKEDIKDNQFWQKIADKSFTDPLLSKYMWDIYWIPALQSLSDIEDCSSILLNELIGIEGIQQRIDGEVKSLYSSLSKGVHHEFIVAHQITQDPDTVKDLLRRTISLVTKLALMSHYIPIAMANINGEELTGCLSEVERHI